MTLSTIVHAYLSIRLTLRTVAVPVTAPGSLLTPVSSQATTSTTATIVTYWQLSRTVSDRCGARGGSRRRSKAPCIRRDGDALRPPVADSARPDGHAGGRREPGGECRAGRHPRMAAAGILLSGMHPARHLDQRGQAHRGLMPDQVRPVDHDPGTGLIAADEPAGYPSARPAQRRPQPAWRRKRRLG